jgi:hypothetical protein
MQTNSTAERTHGSLHPACWAIGDTINFPPYRMIWKVEQVVESGLVISHIENGGHRHLVEWPCVEEGVRLN